ncbi:hypothetical protein Dsin_031034 [Dipteronia sinensis]|uniref:PB1-like domain-containing protein n=1 Tax=Dipteronia sinensis TaxID=43782 RepID=A0AAD9ZL64_9ROSI|nr:hypothetical protein Dsin_031034 [Dipteronia sinensis]
MAPYEGHLGHSAYLDDLENYFSFRVYHGGEFDGKRENYIEGTISFFDYVSMDELSLLDMDDIAMELTYDLLVGYWIEVSGNKSLRITGRAGGVNIGPAGVDIGPGGIGVDVGYGGDNIGLGGTGVEVGSGGVNIGLDGVDIGLAGVDIGLGSGGVDIGHASADIGSASGVDDLRSLDGYDGEEDEGGPPRKFIKTKYHEFNPSQDMQDPIFRVGMEFGSADLFRKPQKRLPRFAFVQDVQSPALVPHKQFGYKSPRSKSFMFALAKMKKKMFEKLREEDEMMKLS